MIEPPRREPEACLDVGGFDHSWLVYREALFERAVTAAASLANATIERGGSVALAWERVPGTLRARHTPRRACRAVPLWAGPSISPSPTA